MVGEKETADFTGETPFCQARTGNLSQFFSITLKIRTSSPNFQGKYEREDDLTGTCHLSIMKPGLS